jgi:hypothetical protein
MSRSPSQASPLKLNPTQRAYLLFIGSFTSKAANADAVALRQDWLTLPSIAKKFGIPQFELERSLLDALVLTHVFIGVPKTIEAFATVHEARAHDFSQPVAQPAADYLWSQEVAADPNFSHPDFRQVPPPCSTCRDTDSTAIRRARATATLQSIYTTTVPGLESFLRSLHPTLHFGITTHAYGAMMCTTALKLFEIETVAVAILSGLHTPRQLLSHLRGATIVGLPHDFISALIDEVFEDVWQDDGIHGESKEVWRNFQRALRQKAAKDAGQTIDPAAEAQARQDADFDDQVQRSKRMAKQGLQHPLFTAGQHAGRGEPDLDADDLEQQLEPAPKKPPADNDAAAPAASSEPTEEEIDATMKAIMKKRQRNIAAEVALRQTGSGAAGPVDDRWPIPPHVLDPSGIGMGMGMGADAGVGGPGMGMMSGFGGMGMGAMTMRSRL